MRFNWKRRMIYYYAKIVRDDGTPSYIARGWALGMFVGCVIPMSIQLMISIPLSFVLRGSKIGAALGTLITNPVTVFFIYPAQCWFGNKVIGGDLSYSATEQALKSILTDGSWNAFASLGWDLIASFFVGGLALALVCTPITYIVVYNLVVRYRRMKERLKAKRMAKKASQTE